jgi:hypothetical protein
VNETGSHVEREKSKQPKNNQNCGDYPKHVFISLMLSGASSTIFFFRKAPMLAVLMCSTNTRMRVVIHKMEVCPVVNTFAFSFHIELNCITAAAPKFPLVGPAETASGMVAVRALQTVSEKCPRTMPVERRRNASRCGKGQRRHARGTSDMLEKKADEAYSAAQRNRDLWCTDQFG